MALISTGTGYWPQIFAAVVLAVTGNSITFVASNVVAFAHAGPDEQSLLNRKAGWRRTRPRHHGRRGRQSDPRRRRYQAAFWTAAALAGLGLAIAVLFARRARPATTELAGDPF